MTELNNIIKIMEEKNISYRYIATRSGLSMSTIWHVANGRKTPNQLTMMRISKALNLKTEEVFNMNWNDNTLF